MNRDSSQISKKLRVDKLSIHEVHDFIDYDHDLEPNMKLSHAFLIVLILHILAVGGLYIFNYLKVSKDDVSNQPEYSHSISKNRATNFANVAKNKDPFQSNKMLNSVSKSVESKKNISTNTQLSSKKNIVFTTATGVAVGLALSSPEADAENVPVYSENSNPDHMTDNGQSVVVPQIIPGQISTPDTGTTNDSITNDNTNNNISNINEDHSTTNANSVSSSDSIYIVTKGDSPYKIAKKFKITPEELMKANNIKNPRKIQIGQKLLIPHPVAKHKK